MSGVAGRRPPWREFRAALDAAGFHPSRKLGQNFLLDENTANAIARDGQVGEGDLVLEVGVGCGFLSTALLATGARLLGIEVDRRLYAIAEEFLTPLARPGQLELVRADVLAKKRELAPEVLERLPDAGEPWHLVSNLPYSIASPLLVSLSRLAHPPASMTVLVQAEVAERLCAKPATSSWGGLSAKLHLLYSGRMTRRVGAALFSPRPKVESAVARLELRAERPPAADVAAADTLIDAFFQARRKTLRATLARHLGDRPAAEAALDRAGLDPGCRPEVLDQTAFLDLARALEVGGR